MKIAYFDCCFGAAGDMLTATLLSAGLDQNLWLQELAKLESIVSPWEEVRRRLDDVQVLIELAREEADPEAYDAEVRAELDAVRARADGQNRQLFGRAPRPTGLSGASR